MERVSDNSKQNIILQADLHIFSVRSKSVIPETYLKFPCIFSLMVVRNTNCNEFTCPLVFMFMMGY